MVAVGANKAANAVIHIGPHKTGTTAIQHYSKVLYPELLSDNYEMPWKHLKQNAKPWENQVEFATCFLLEGDNRRIKYPCRKDLLEAGLNIARQNNHSLLVSAEAFAAAKATGVAELKSYLDQAWGNVTIVATYRRYYEWIVSYHHELNNIKQWAAGTTLWQAIQKNETERIYPGIQDTLSTHRLALEHNNPTAVIERYKQVFSNVVVMNYHDKSKDLIERFYCDAMPNAPNACKKAIETTKTKGEAKINQSYSAVYEELTYAAHRSGMINVHSQKYCEAVTTAIKAHQEKTLKLSSDDFPRACPSSKVLGEIWEISLRSEKAFNRHVNNGLNYEGEGPLLSTSLKDDFDAYAKTSLCHVDVYTVLQSQVWRNFFAEVSKGEFHGASLRGEEEDDDGDGDDVDGDVGKIKIVESSASATADSNGSAASEQCLNLDLNQDMDSLIASSQQIFITMPAKAGGTSMKQFTRECMNDKFADNILNHGQFNKEFLIRNLHAPPIVASHLYNSDGLIRLSKYPSRQTLMIHIHREETNRIVSAVKHLLDKVCTRSPEAWTPSLRKGFNGVDVIKNGNECILEEGPVVDAIVSRTDVIGIAEHDLLNCKSYKALQENGPQLVVINYKQVDKLQTLLAKHHCPHIELPVHANIAEEKSTNVLLKLQTGGVVNIKDWLREKGPSLEVALNLRQGASCQAKTFHMEDELFGCPDEALQVTTESIKGW